VRLRLTGEWAIDAADASGTLLFDVAGRRWSDDVLDALELPRDWFPPVLESAAVAGTLTTAAAEALGLAAGIPVATGSADQPAQGLGNGMIAPGPCRSCSGRPASCSRRSREYAHEPEGRVHAFCHAVPGMWQAMG
jgi:xylulokinase